MTTRVLLVGCLIFLEGCASIGQAIAAASAASAPLSSGYRIVAPATVTEATAPQMIERLARADVVFFGEQHDDPETHRAEAELLDAIGRTGEPSCCRSRCSSATCSPCSTTISRAE